jgi:hypothetical protein
MDIIYSVITKMEPLRYHPYTTALHWTKLQNDTHFRTGSSTFIFQVLQRSPRLHSQAPYQLDSLYEYLMQIYMDNPVI